MSEGTVFGRFAHRGGDDVLDRRSSRAMIRDGGVGVEGGKIGKNRAASYIADTATAERLWSQSQPLLAG